MRSVLVLLLSLMVAFAGCFGDGADDGDGDGSDPGTGDGDDGPTDSDGDGVPDDQDVCDGHDDNVDSDGDGTPDGCDDTPQGEDEDPGPKRGAETWDLTIEDNSFPGGSIDVQVGDTVRWTHEGNNPHTVTSDDGEFDSGSDTVLDYMQNGDTFEETFDEVGDFPYYCEVHPSMTGTITVLERHDPTPS